MILTSSTFIAQGNPELQDRFDVIDFDTSRALVVADGVGGRSGAAEAAEFVIRTTRAVSNRLSDGASCVNLLREMDQRLAGAQDGGETTAVIVIVGSNKIYGANVGDSTAWFFAQSGSEELTRARKPYLGTGAALPHKFEHTLIEGTIVVASDGLWKYTDLKLITEKVRTEEPKKLAVALGDLVRLRSSAFQDDIAVVTCHIRSS